MSSGIAIVAAGHVVAGLGEAAGVDPAAAGGRAVVAQRGEARDLLALLEQHLGRIGRIGDVLDHVAVDLLGELVRVRIVGILVGPVQFRIGSGKAPPSFSYSAFRRR